MAEGRVYEIQWDRYPFIAHIPHAKAWLSIQTNLLLAPNTVEAYGRGLEDFLAFLSKLGVDFQQITREHVALYVRDLAQRPNPRGDCVRVLDSGVGLSNATMNQRITVVRLFYAYLMEEGIRADSPVGRGHYTPGKGYGGKRDRTLLPRYEKLPWIPNELEWQAILEAAKGETLRNRLMLVWAYDAALRREELCGLHTASIDPAHRLLRISPDTTKGHRERTVPYGEATNRLYMAYLQERRALSRERGPLFLSESRRNHARPLSIWTWSKVVESIAEQSGVERLTTHTFRHLRLTDLARSGWGIHEIATFAGHRSLDSTLRYIHLSGRDLQAKLERGMAEIHAWRLKTTMEMLS